MTIFLVHGTKDLESLGLSWVINGWCISLVLSSMVVCFDFCLTNVVQLSNWNPYFYRFQSHHPLITQLTLDNNTSLQFFFTSTLEINTKYGTIIFEKKIHIKNLQFQTLLLLYKKCVTEKRTYANKGCNLLDSNNFVVNTL